MTQNKPITIYPWKAPLPVKLFVWFGYLLFLSPLPLIGLDHLFRPNTDKGVLIILLIGYLLLLVPLCVAVFWLKKRSLQALQAIANELNLKPFYSRGGIPAIVYWPGLTGQRENFKIFCIMARGRRLRRTYVEIKGGALGLKKVVERLTQLRPKMKILPISGGIAFYLWGTVIEKETGEELKKCLQALAS